MIGNLKIYGNKRALEQLSDYWENNRMPHSLLFFGEEGTGKKTLADYTAMLYFCEKGENTPCMSCKNCQRTETHIHPDIIYVNCGSTAVLQLREILRDSHGMPVEGGIRVYILSEFHLFNRECQNALLTYLEEPSDRVRFILTASNKNGILPTILSRTALIQTYPLSEEECESVLSEKGIANCAELSKMYKGNLGLALKAAENKNAAVYFDFARELAEAVLDGDEYSALVIGQKLPQPKEDKREPVRAAVLESGRIFHDAFSLASGGKATCGCDEILAEKLSKKYPISILDGLCKEAQRFGETAVNIYFNSKITFNAYVSALFGVIE